MAFIGHIISMYWKVDTTKGESGGSYLLPNAEEGGFSFLAFDTNLSRKRMLPWAEKLSELQLQVSWLEHVRQDAVVAA